MKLERAVGKNEELEILVPLVQSTAINQTPLSYFPHNLSNFALIFQFRLTFLTSTVAFSLQLNFPTSLGISNSILSNFIWNFPTINLPTLRYFQLPLQATEFPDIANVSYDDK